MKKYLFIALAAAAMTSCSQDEVMEMNQEAISFGGAFVENATRATDPSYGSNNQLTAFNVWGNIKGLSDKAVAVFANDNVTGTVGTGQVWNCTSKTQYWIAGATYNFAAVVNGTVATLDNELPKTITYVAAGDNDLLYARSQQYIGLSSNNPLVKFEFAHLLSKVKFTLENTTSNATNVGEYTYTLTDIKITNAITEGTYTVTDTPKTENGVTTYTIGGTWASTEANGQAFDSIEDVTNTTSKDCANEKLLVPLADAKVSCKINLYYGGELISTVSKENVSVGGLIAGYAYNIKVSVGLTNEIKFTVEENPEWTTAADITVQ